MAGKTDTDGVSTHSCRAARVFAHNLHRWRKSVGLPLKDVADHLGVSVSIVCAWERGKRFPNIFHLEKLSEYTGIAVDKLFLSNGAKSEDNPRRAVVEIDAGGRILAAGNSPAKSTARHVVGSSIFEHIPLDRRAGLRTAISEAKASGKSAVEGIPFTALEKATWWLSHIAPVPNGGAADKFVVVCTDRPTGGEPDQPSGRAQESESGLCRLMNTGLRNLSLLRRYLAIGPHHPCHGLIEETQRVMKEAASVAGEGQGVDNPGIAPVARPAPMAGSGQRTVLIVEGETAPAEELGSLLRSLGHNVLTVNNGRRALDKARCYVGRIDLTILDMTMPAMGGARAYSRLKELRPDMKVLISGLHEDDPAAQRLLGAGADGVVGEQPSLTGLSSAISHLFAP